MNRIKNCFLIVSLLIAGVFLAPQVQAEEYVIDPGHSTLGFSIKHLLVSKTTGQFDQYDGKINFDPDDLAASKIDVTIQSESINTRLDKRDTHLKAAEFFDVTKFPTITFVSKNITKEGEQYKITGDLTIKGVTKEVSFPAKIAGPVKTPAGGAAIGVEAAFQLNRQDYGITWNKALDSGGYMVGDDVDVNINVEAHTKK